ncbi:MAG: GH3 auxin-responsive promoter family protein [Nitrososphaerota archaeon]
MGSIFSYLYLRGVRFKRIQEIIENAEVVISGGESLEPYRRKLKSFYSNAQFFEGYGSTELILGGMIQLSEKTSLSPILGWFIPEIAKPEDIRKAKKDPNYSIETIPWWKWHSGLKGELIITRMGECLPLIRYPTGDLVEVVEARKNIPIKVNGKLKYITLPEVKILGRSVEVLPPDASEDEMLIFSVARVYPSEIKMRLSEMGELKMKHFDLYVYRPTSKRPAPKWKLEIIPEEKILDKEKMAEKVKEKLVKTTELYQTLEALSLAYPKEYVEKLFEVEILQPEDYQKVVREMEEKMSKNRPLGQIKPSHVHFIKEADVDD